MEPLTPPLAGVSPWVRLVRFEEYGPLFILCGVAGAAYAGGGLSDGLAGLTAFIATFSASAFVLNDIADWRDDAATPGTRNPLATGELKVSAGVALFALLAAGSAASLYFVSPRSLYMAPFVYGLYWGYSSGPGFKARPGVDVVAHGAVPAIFVLMGYALYAPLSAGAALLSGTVFCFAAMSGVLQEVRDLAKDSLSRRTTAMALGGPSSVGLALALMLCGVSLYALASAEGYLPLRMLLLVPSAALLVRPLLELRGGRAQAEDAIRAVRGRGVAIALGAVLLYLAVPA
jgi:4-hydroxybenzoate polyprenyltransferase